MELPRRPTLAKHRRRRAAALALIAVLAVGAWLLFARDAGDDEQEGGDAAAGERAPVTGPAAGLDDEQLVDQVLLLGFDGTGTESEVFDELAERELGGVLVAAANWPDAATGTALVERLARAGRADGRVPPLIATSQEGGAYRELADLPPEQTELEIGDGGSPAAAVEWALATAQALAGAGFDLNLAPVADVATLDSPVADRAFSDDAQVAAEMTAAAVRGCRQGEIACAAAHFPGLGAASQDTSLGPATVSLDAAGLASRDLVPFEAAFAERAPAVVLSLAAYVAYDPVTPAAMAEPVATGLLRDELGFDGVAITDDLGAGAVRAGYRVPEAAVTALAAGADLVQIGSVADQRQVRERILAALESGELSRARLGEAAGRVLALKRDLGLSAAE